MEKKIMLLLILILATAATAQVPTYQLECILPAPHCTSVDLSPDGTKLCARIQYGGWNEGYRVFDANTTDICTYAILSDCGGYWAPWVGRVSADSAYLWTTLYYRGCVAKIDLSTCAEPTCIPVGPWPMGLAFDSQRRYLYVGVNCPGTGAIGSLKVIDTNTEQVVGSVPLNGEPGECIVVDPSDEFVYLVTRNPGTETLYKIRTSDLNYVNLALPDVVGNVDPGISVSPDGATIYVPYPNADLVYAIDTATLSIVDTWSIGSVESFFASPDGTHALVTGYLSPNIAVFDLVSEQIVYTIDVCDVGVGTPYYEHWTSPYWDTNRGKVYVNIPATEGGVAVLVAAPADPVELLQELAGKVIALNLQHGISNSLDAKIDAALKALEDINENNDIAAINTLEAFINAIEAQRGNKIPEADADDLIADVLEIIDLLSAE